MDRETDAQKIRNNISSVDEKELSAAIYEIMKGLGMSEEQSRRASRNAGFFKKAIGQASDREIDGIMEKLGSEKALEWKKKLHLES